jgi:TetR/AcrR family transcriptional repressor of mexJK operon
MDGMNNRERLLAAAMEVFLEHGYGASVDMLVHRAGVARQTFYNHFHNKENLFAEAMRLCVSEMLVPLDAHAGDVRETLLQFGFAYRQRVLSPQSIAKFRIVTAQAQRFPELTGEDYAQGLGKMLKRVAEFLRTAMEEGQLRRDDPDFAAEMLLSMLAAMERARMLFGVPNPPHDETQRVKKVIDGFLRMFAPGD